MEIDGSQHHGSISLSLLFEELTRCSLLNYFAQPDKLICPLIWPHVTPTVKIVRCRGVDRAQNYGRGCSPRPLALGVLQVHLVRRRAGGASRSWQRRLPQAFTPISSPRRSASPRTLCGNSPKPDSITCRYRSRTASVRPPTASPATKAPSPGKCALAAEVVCLKIPLTVNAVMHRANIDHIEIMVALALALGANWVEIARVQYYGWALKNRAALMPSAEQLERAAARSRNCAAGITARSSSTRSCPTITRGLRSHASAGGARPT
jgi:hypothetical protein